ncbi:MAG: hypothetical protein ACLP9L_27370 [Thermoguttaceae bacterium]
MKALWLTRNCRHSQAGTRRGAPRLSLFPFLAVLICTMGALMLLLLFVTRQARLQAAKETAAKNAEQQSSITSEMEMVEWRVEQLKKSRKETEAHRAEARLVLGHIEDHGRRLRDQFQELSRQAKKAAEEGLKPGRFIAAGEEELRQVEGQVAEAQQRLTQAQQTAANRPKSYAIVPYDGPNRTRRRPIYIECRGDAVVLQPENIAFSEADFDEPLGPGNPLAAAVRAAREQMLLQGSVDPKNAGEPYPLLLVRPAGIPAYDCALAAMKSWGSEFGYELINEDWQLKYPPPDPNLAKAMVQARDLARQEHARLIAAAPSKYGKRPRSGSFRSSTGGEAGEQGGAGEGESPGFYSSKPSDRYAHGYAGDGSPPRGRSGNGNGGSGGSGESGRNSGSGSGGGSDGPNGDAEFAANNPYAALPASGAVGSPAMLPGGMGSGSGYGPSGGAGGAPGSGVAGGAVGSPAMLPGGMGSGSGYGPGGGAGGAPGTGVAGGAAGPPVMFPGGMGNGSGYGPGSGVGSAPGSGVAGGAAGSPSISPGGNGISNAVAGGPAGAPNTNASGGANNYPPPGSQYAMQPNGQPAASSSTTAGVVRPDGYINGQPNDGNPAPVRPNPPSSMATAPAAPLRPGEWRPSEDPPKPDRDAEEKEKNEKKKHPYDKVKMDHDQDDWALRNASRHAAAISRPIHVECYADRIVVVPDAGSSEPQVILCDTGGRRDADKLVAAVWEIMDTWGMAGREMYWRPILNFYVAPGAEPRMLDLTRSLEGSGLVIERKR